jgi:alpha-N-arabinofuranosidase
MYSVHQDATLLPAELDSAGYTMGDATIPQLSVSASRDERGKVHVSLCNLHHEDSAEVSCLVGGMNAQTVTGRILTGPAMSSRNTFDQPDAITPAPFEGFALGTDGPRGSLPPRSVVVLEIV